MRRKATKTTRGPNEQEKAFQAWLKRQPCAVGGNGITEVHHCKGSTYKHNKVLIGHWFCIPLSQSAHSAYHNGSKKWKLMHGLQSNIWVLHMIDYIAETGIEPPYDVYDAIVDCGE